MQTGLSLNVSVSSANSQSFTYSGRHAHLCMLVSSSRLFQDMPSACVIGNCEMHPAPSKERRWLQVHAEWPTRLAKMVAEEGSRIERFFHFSDIGADPAHPGERMRSKAAGEAAVLEAIPDATIFR